MPIRPQYAQPIMMGRKTVEFRKVAFHGSVTHVIVYASSPIKMIIGFFEVETVDRDTPERLWERYGDVGAISNEDYNEYYAKTRVGTAIRVGKVWALEEPVPLAELDPSLLAPQSFAYVDDATLGKLKNMKCLLIKNKKGA